MIALPIWGEGGPEGPEELGDTQDFSDMLFEPVGPPEPDPEATPEQLREEAFHAEHVADNYANEETGQWHRAGRDMSEVCVTTGWPPRHLRVGRHCPHGLLDQHPDEIIDLT
jgi:hypothetical protein